LASTGFIEMNSIDSYEEPPMAYLQPVAEFQTAFVCREFAGAAAYIILVEHPVP
jgi:hypothetical protein